MSQITGSERQATRRAFLAAGSVAVLGSTTGLGQGSVVAVQESNGDESGQPDAPRQQVVARQEQGETFYWVLPGERRLSPSVFGTPENPRFGTAMLEYRIEQAKGLPEPLGNAVPQLLADLPPLVAAPENARKPVQDEETIAQQVFTQPTLYSNNAEVTSGQFEVTYNDYRPYDLRGPPGETPDTVDLTATFTDPADNEYELAFDHIVQPPIPGYRTGGGVMIDAWHHGKTGTGSPLMPQLYNYGAFWGIGNVLVNGEVADENKLIHFMTTQTVRDARYRLVLDEELPLAPENTIAGQVHHTHGVVLPITATPEGPVHEPVKTAFELPNGQPQPFIHGMWEQEELVEAPFAEWSWPGATEQSAAEGQGTDGNQTTAQSADARLGAAATGWVGQAPPAIEGTTNPTLPLRAGTEYTFVWENRDGLQHNFAIQDRNGEDVLSTDLVGEEGATQTVTFTATPEMAEYYCQVHPNTMRGSLDVQSER